MTSATRWASRPKQAWRDPLEYAFATLNRPMSHDGACPMSPDLCHLNEFGTCGLLPGIDQFNARTVEVAKIAVGVGCGGVQVTLLATHVCDRRNRAFVRLGRIELLLTASNANA
jgi:hypothetical protein